MKLSDIELPMLVQGRKMKLKGYCAVTLMVRTPPAVAVWVAVSVTWPRIRNGVLASAALLCADVKAQVLELKQLTMAARAASAASVRCDCAVMKKRPKIRDRDHDEDERNRDQREFHRRRAAPPKAAHRLTDSGQHTVPCCSSARQ